MKVSLIAAVAANGVIGDDGRVPWNYPEDLSHFRQTTVGHPVIMGRRTFETIYQQLGEPLPQRRNIVLTHRPESLPEAAVPATSQSAALRAATEASTTTAYVIGGGSVYDQFLPRSDELVLTELHASFEGDTVFPAVDWDEWREIDRDCREEFDIVTYVRNDPDSFPSE